MRRRCYIRCYMEEQTAHRLHFSALSPILISRRVIHDEGKNRVRVRGQMEMASMQLPVQLTSFIGRQRELAALQRVLSTARLVTVTGAGGCGKTRLAVQAASMVGEGFADGAHFVQL